MTPTKSILADRRTYDSEILTAHQINSTLPKNFEQRKSRTIRVTQRTNHEVEKNVIEDKEDEIVLAASKPVPQVGGLPERTLKAYRTSGNNSPNSQNRPSSLLNKLIDRTKVLNKETSETQDNTPQEQKDPIVNVEVRSEEITTLELKSDQTQPGEPSKPASDRSVKGAAAVPTLNLNKEEIKLSIDSELNKQQDA